jgi:hypothetical protein
MDKGLTKFDVSSNRISKRISNTMNYRICKQLKYK